MKLSALIQAAGIDVRFSKDVEILELCDDSREVVPGSLFVCVPGLNRNSQTYISSAVAQGAVAVAVFDEAGLELAGDTPWVLLHQFHEQIFLLTHAFYRNPSADLQVFGITGTNGKTTTAWIIRDILNSLGVPTAYLGTLGCELFSERIALRNTTPFAVEFAQLLKRVVDSGCKALAVEISSHALDQKRADGLQLDGATFTNLTQDHLDYHHTLESYSRAKHRLFSDLLMHSDKTHKWAVFNLGDPTGKRWMEGFDGPKLGFLVVPSDWSRQGCDDQTVYCRPISVGLASSELEFYYRGETRTVVTKLGGIYNVENCTAAVATLTNHYPFLDVVTALGQVRPVPGRFEFVENDGGIQVIVDYAHTPDALEKLLDSVRAAFEGRIITVFGCGGDRDTKKRPLMAKVAVERSFLTVFTSDNPRSEDPLAILNQLSEGAPKSANYAKILDRREAILYAVRRSKPGDIIIIAGKGHETGQIVGGETVPFDDRLVAKEAIDACIS